MEIDIKEFLSADEIKEVCKDALYSKIREDMRNLNVNDIIANISYAEVAAMVDTHIGEDNYCKKTIAQKTKQIIESLSSYSVFHKADAWERKNSIAYDIMEEECRAARPLIKQRIEQIVKEYDFPMLSRDDIMYTLADTLTSLFFKEDNDG